MHRFLAAWLVVAACLPIVLGACWADQGATASSSPDELFAAGRFPQARDAYEALLKQYPTRVDLQIGLIRTLLRLDDWQGAITTGELAIQNIPNNADINGLYAIACRRGGQMDTAAASAAQALKLDPKSYWALVASGEMALWDDRQADALSDFEQATQIDPNEPDAWLGELSVGEDPANPKIAGLEAKIERSMQAYANLAPKGYPHDNYLPEVRDVLTPAAQKLIAEAKAHPPSYVAPLTQAEFEALDNGVGIFTIKMPISIDNGQILVPMTIDGHAFQMSLDTGSYGITLNKQAAAELKLRPGAPIQVTGAQGNAEETNYFADSASLGSLVIKPVLVGKLDLPNSGKRGALGLAALQYFLITIDLKNKMLILTRGRDAVPPDPIPGALRVTAPFHLLDSHIMVPTSVDSKSTWQPPLVWAMFDTGSSDNALSLSLANRLASNYAVSDISRGTSTDPFAIGKTALRVQWIQMPGPYLTVGTENNRLYEQPSDISGLSVLGSIMSPATGIEINAILGEPYCEMCSRVTIDYRRHQLTFDFFSATPSTGNNDRASSSNSSQGN